MPNSAELLPPSVEELKSRLAPFCRRHGIARLEVFGSVAQGQARFGSDVDLLITFRADRHPGLEFFGLQEELEQLLGCPVDLHTRRAAEQDPNPIRRREIFQSVQEIYAA
jgi:uncharacterized protein